MQNQITGELNWSAQQTNRVVDLAAKGFTAEGIHHETGCGLGKARRLLNLLYPSGPPVKRERATYINSRKTMYVKPKIDTALRKERKCLRCGSVFMSDGPGNRICNSPECQPHNNQEFQCPENMAFAR